MTPTVKMKPTYRTMKVKNTDHITKKWTKLEKQFTTSYHDMNGNSSQLVVIDVAVNSQ